MAAWAMAIAQGGAGAGSTADAIMVNYKAQTAAARAAQEYDKNVLASAAQSIGRLNVARAGMYRQATGALVSLKEKKKAVEGKVGVSLASTDTVGASAIAAMSDVSVQADKAVAQVRRNVAVSDWNFNNTHSDILTQASTAFRGDKLTHVLTRQEADRMAFRGFLGGFLGASSVAGSPKGPSEKEQTETGGWEYKGEQDSSTYSGEDQKHADQGESMGNWEWKAAE